MEKTLNRSEYITLDKFGNRVNIGSFILFRDVDAILQGRVVKSKNHLCFRCRYKDGSYHTNRLSTFAFDPEKDWELTEDTSYKLNDYPIIIYK